MSNIYAITARAELTRTELDAFLNSERTNFIIPVDRQEATDDHFFSIDLDRDSLPEKLKGLPDDTVMTVGKHKDGAETFKERRDYHVAISYTQWKETVDVDVFSYLTDYSDRVAIDVVDRDADLQGTHFLDFPRAPHYVYAAVHIDGETVEYSTNQEVMDNLFFYQSKENIEKMSQL